MYYEYDFIAMPRRCEVCGLTLAAGEGDVIRTQLARSNSRRTYRVGDTIEVPADSASILDSGFWFGPAIPSSLDDLWLLLLWRCPTPDCAADNALLVHVRDGVLTATECAPLAKALCRANFISQDITGHHLRRVYQQRFPGADLETTAVMGIDDFLDELCEDDDPRE